MSDQNGFTLIEVVIALLILSVVMLGLAGTTGALLVRTARNDAETEAVELVDDRIETIQTDPDYANLAANYQGTETSLPGHPEKKRTTIIVPMTVPGAGRIDAKKVTVRVTAPVLKQPVARTAVRSK